MASSRNTVASQINEKEKIQEIQESLKKLGTWVGEGIYKKYAEVKDLEEKIQVDLDIPRECWNNSGHQLKDRVKSLQEKLEISQTSALYTEWISDEEVLKNASGGLALEGIYLTRNPKDMLANRQQLVDVPKSFSLIKPEKGATFQKREFSSKHSEQVFNKTMERLGISFSYLLNTGCETFGFQFGFEQKYFKKGLDISSNISEKPYFLNTKCHCIPQASGYLKKEDVKLTTGALKELKKIETILKSGDEQMVTDRVKRFYEQFGSHVNKGPLHFGGIFRWKASVSDFKTAEISEVERMTSESLDLYCGSSYNLPGADCIEDSNSLVKRNLTGKYRDELIDQLDLSIHKTGGPAETDDHFLWKSHLTTSNKSWSVIDRGTGLIPVWEIASVSHKADFVNVEELSRTLNKLYINITGMTEEEAGGENILAEVDKAKTILQSIEGLSSSDCESDLVRLVRVKKDIGEKTGSQTLWVQKYLSSEILQKYLQNVATTNRDSTSSNLRMLVRSLSFCSDIGNFPGKKMIEEWANQSKPDPTNPVVSVSEFSELETVLQNVTAILGGSTYKSMSVEDECRVREQSTKTITFSLNSFCETLRDQGDREAELLILSITTAIGYSAEMRQFNYQLSRKEITFLQAELQKALSTYSSLKRQCVTKAQAFIVHNALTLSFEKDTPISHQTKSQRIQLIERLLKDRLSKPIAEAIQDRKDWSTLEGLLESIQKGKKTNAKKVSDKKEPSNEHRFMDLLNRLGLQDSYPKMVTKAEVLKVNHLSVSLAEPNTEQNLCALSLYKLMMLDYRSRHIFLNSKATNPIVKDDCGNTSMDDNDDDNVFDFESESSDEAFCEKPNLHPMDLQMAIFHCSDDFLRQYIFAKLSACQFSLPFLVPNPCNDEVEFPLWALRHIRKSWHGKTEYTSEKQGKYHNKVMFDTQVPFVSFIRIGDSEFNSKSQILNTVISRQKHNVFFHRHCIGSSPDSFLMKGVVEIAWHCPGGRKDDLFCDCLAFLNLRGDAEEHSKQLEFLQSISTVIVVLLSEHPLSETAKKLCKSLSGSSVPLICLFSGQTGKSKSVTKLPAKNRNQAELTEELIKSIKHCIGTNKTMATIESCSEEARKQKFIIDEDGHSFKDAFTQTTVLTSLLKDEQVSSLKKNVMPLQGKLWHEWCQKNKEQYRLHIKENESIAQQQSKITTDMACIRTRQYLKAFPLNDFLRSFLECFTTLAHSDGHVYMLEWLTIFLDNLTSGDLALLEEKQQSTWQKVKGNHLGKEETDGLLQELDQINDQIANATVRLPHIMREVGQLYEAVQAVGLTETKGSVLNELPKIGMTILMSGYPLEILDGDASHVPTKWIEAVLDELINTIEDKKVFVISILGLQSSGKSTLLNAMFGLQFVVSAGRCTKGAFMQLLHVDSSLQSELGYDYILIVDTEGIRSPELTTKISQSHDNELATFIIGIGDVTIINIMGENPSEMQDILQICVQAFLRMKQVKITPSCYFVHQNVAESSASNKTIEGRRRLLEKLDEMARMAAREENIDDITRFSDVIQFDIDAQVFYFKNLLEGDPPMAPPNPSYSQNVQELKMKVLTTASLQRKGGFATLSQFKCRVSDLWNALLQENFVFSFRNTVELMVFSALEKKCGQWSWALRKFSLKVQSEYENLIGSNIAKYVNAKDLARRYDEVYTQLTSEIDRYFREDRNKEILIKWQVSIDKRFENLRDELIIGTRKKCKALITARENRLDLDRRNIQYTSELTEKSKKLASTLQGKQLTDEQVLKEFNNLWDNWTEEVLIRQPKEATPDLRPQIESVLYSNFKDQRKIQEKIDQYSSERFQFNPQKHIDRHWMKKGWDWLNGKSFDREVRVFVEDVTQAVNAYIHAKEKKTDFDCNFIHEILSDIEKQIKEFENRPKSPTLTSLFRTELSLHQCLHNVNRFQKMHEDFKEANHPLTYLKSQRNKYLQCFRNYCERAGSVRIFVDFLCQHIAPEIVRVAGQTVSQQIVDLMKCNESAFSGNRSNLENHILRHLAIQQNFSLYEEYIDHPKTYFRRYIKEKVEEFARHSEALKSCQQEILGTLKEEILSTSKTNTTNKSGLASDTKTWLDAFCRGIGHLITINRGELCDIEEEFIRDWEFFQDRMVESLGGIISNVNIDLDASADKAADILFQQMEGCWAQCPFCGAICTNTIPNHDEKHSVKFHRCDALRGWHYHDTDYFCVDFCTIRVCSDMKFYTNEGQLFPYKTYADAGDPYDKWSITADGSIQGYWKWFIWQFQSDWEKKYNYKFQDLGTIPPDWQYITKDSVLEELK